MSWSVNSGGFRRGTIGKSDNTEFVISGKFTKLLIVEQTTAVIGSIALRAEAFQWGRELAVVIHEPAVLRQLDAFWPSRSPAEARWQPRRAALQAIRP